MATPLLTYEYKLKEQKKRIIKKQQIPSGHNKKNYNLDRVYAISHDGKKIPISIIKRKDTPKNAPTLLYGYGSYGISISPSFSVSRLSLIDRGMVYAIAHIRGGMEKGKKWYEDGKKKNKLNSFKDFIACAEFLKKENISENITIHGGSAGGLLIGASINISPDTFHCAVAEVPFVDVLNTILDDTLPLTPPEWEEWGNPIKSKSDFEYIGSYSPYDNIKEQNYPTILATSGLTDPRVTYWEATKWIAKLRSKKTNDNPMFLKTYTEAGHGGMAGRYNQIKETAFIYAFILWRNNLIKRSFSS
jgi:oligopeptidase B